MDPVSLSSGVAGLITLALQVGGALTQYATALKDRKKNIRELQDEIILLQDVLSKLRELIASEESKGRQFDSDSVLRNAIKDCTARVERIGTKLRSSEGGRLARTIDRLTWPFQETEVVRLVESLRRFHATFSFALTTQNCLILSRTAEDAEKILQKTMEMSKQTAEMYTQMNMPAEEPLAKSAEIERFLAILPTLREQAQDINEINQTTKYLEEKAQEDRKAEILDWLLPKSALDKHSRIQDSRAKDTCQWFLSHENFIEWSNMRQENRDMLCQGPPGAGKTVLASAVIDHLRQAHETEDSVAVLYYYCSHSEEKIQTGANFARSLLRQLCHTRKLPPVVAEFYQRHRHDVEDIPWFQKLKLVLGRVVATFDEVYIVVDALDEVGGDRQRRDLFAVLETVRDSNTFIHVFATTRPHVDGINESLKNPSTIDVVANEGDLRRYLSDRIDNHHDSDSIMDVILKEEIISRLCANANGIFLLPKLQIDQILDQITRADLRRALNSLSQSLYEAFRSTLDRIRGLSTKRKDLAFSIMMWVSHARRPLRMKELQHALATRFEDSEFDEEHVVSSRTILLSCFGLVERDSDDFVRFVHFSLEEYLRSADHGFFQDGQTIVTRTCLKYLSFPWLKPLPPKNRNDFILALDDLPFAAYATCEWGNHAKSVNVQDYQDLVVPLLDSTLHLLAMARIRDFDLPDFRKWKERMTAWAYSGGAGISIASSFGLTDLVRLLISQQRHPKLHAKDFRRSGPLHHAAALGYTDTCQALIAHGANLRDVNASNQTPFFLAIHYGQLQTASVLLQYDRQQIDIRSRGGTTPLHRAVELDSEPLVTFLLRSGALIGAPDEKHNTALHLACERGNLAIARLLVLAGADVNGNGAKYFLPIDFAVTTGHISLVRYLLEQNAFFDYEAGDALKPIHRAARRGHTEIVKILLERGASPSQTNRRRITPLQLAAKEGTLECAKAIVHHDPDQSLQILQQKDKKGETASQIAFTSARYDVYKYLRDTEHELLAAQGSQIQVFDPTLPLSLAIEASNLESVKEILQNNPALIFTQSLSHLLPIHLAFQEQNLAIAQYLLEVGADIQSRAYHGWTPLHIGASVGALAMVELALQHGAQINAVTDSRQSALHKACSSGSIAVVRFLLRSGADPRAQNDIGLTPMHVAALQNFAEGVRELCKPEWNAEETLLWPDYRNELPRNWAEKRGLFEMSTFLRVRERRLKQYNYNRRGGDLLSPQASALQMVRTNSQNSARSISPRHSLVSSNAEEDVQDGYVSRSPLRHSLVSSHAEEDAQDGYLSRSSLVLEGEAEKATSPAVQLAALDLGGETD